MGKTLTIGMAVYDDWEGLYNTVQDLRLYHAGVLDEFEILIVDNHPDSEHGRYCRRLAENWGKGVVRYTTFTDYHATTVKGKVFEWAETPYVLCIDAHVKLAPLAVLSLLEYYRRHPDTRDLIHGPLLGNDMDVYATHQKLVWRSEMWGIWADGPEKDPRGLERQGPAFEIESHGTGLFSCRREIWPGFSPHCRGFGGEEGVLQAKFRKQGGKVLCLPALRWLHRFDRVGPCPHPLRVMDTYKNYLLGFLELDLSPKPVMDHFLNRLTQQDMIAGAQVAYRLAGKPLHIEDARTMRLAEPAAPPAPQRLKGKYDFV